jgi:hypothetical protein
MHAPVRGTTGIARGFIVLLLVTFAGPVGAPVRKPCRTAQALAIQSVVVTSAVGWRLGRGTAPAGARMLRPRARASVETRRMRGNRDMAGPPSDHHRVPSAGTLSVVRRFNAVEVKTATI